MEHSYIQISVRRNNATMWVKKNNPLKTIVFLPVDAHGHTNPMLSLAAEMKELGYRTIFITYTTDTAKYFGHESILLNSANIDGKQVGEGASSSSTCIAASEQEVYLNAKLFDDDWGSKRLLFNAEMADGPANDGITLKTVHNNLSLWPRMAAKANETDAMLERILIALEPHLVITELTPMRPALVRLSRESYARRIAGWTRALRWMTLVSLGPMWVHYCAHLANQSSSNAPCDPTTASHGASDQAKTKRSRL